MSVATADALMGVFGMKRVNGNPILSIDPGTTHSGVVHFAGGIPLTAGVYPNGDVLTHLSEWRGAVAIERFEARGMPVGDESVETVLWTGRFMQAAGMDRVRLIKRSAVKSHICGSQRASDANIRQALIDKWGGKAEAIGTVKRQGPLYHVKSHAWAALAVAIVASETRA
jgi:hypothetical protein